MRAAVGLDVPIPTFPILDILILSPREPDPLVSKIKSESAELGESVLLDCISSEIVPTDVELENKILAVSFNVPELFCTCIATSPDPFVFDTVKSAVGELFVPTETRLPVVIKIVDVPDTAEVFAA